jgi:predicted glycogen debranching enzyme
MLETCRREDAPQDVAAGCRGAGGRIKLAAMTPPPAAAPFLYTIDTLGRLDPHVSQEWLLTNGQGGFAAGTVVGCNTRRYHGLLVAATLPPVGRVLALSRLGEQLVLDGNAAGAHEFSVNRFRDAVFPRGDQYLRRFDLGDAARWAYDVDGARVTKQVQLLWGRNVVGVRYDVESPDPARKLRLSLAPFTGLRDFHAMRRAGDVHFDVTAGPRDVKVAEERLALRVWADAGRFEEAADWWYGHVYPVETDRGQDDTEDLFTPGRFVVEGTGKLSITLWADIDGLGRRAASQAGALHPPMRSFDWDGELAARRAAIEATVSPKAPVKAADSQAVKRLAHAANDFIVYRKAPDGADGSTVLAGYPWFADWGRDTFISLPGLFLTTGRFAQAKQVLGVFASYVSEGMIPNRFDDYDNTPHYNTVDASLWFIHAAFEYARLSGDKAAFDRTLLPACQAILKGYRSGTRFGIKMDERDALITQGDSSTQLTPRQGKAVEINALWYHALRLMKDDATADRVKESFAKAFWVSPFRGLADVVHADDGTKDLAIRPNQIFAVSLPNSPLTPDQQSAVVEVVRRELLTPAGLRTLSRDHVRYQGRYAGPQPVRDEAYHNGTIWPWPIGAFLDAYLKVNGRSPQSILQARAWLRPLIDGMQTTACIGSISEIYEADTLRPVGCPAQAWSVAEVLRLAVELGV